MEAYNVLLNRREDLDSFYDDMETEGGSLYIPDRACDCCCKRPMSRNTMYVLTAEEAATVKEDSRVKVVSRMSEVVDPEPSAFIRSNYSYDKSVFDPPNSGNSKNWATWRTKNSYADNKTLINNWYPDNYGNPPGGEDITGSESFTESGKNIDIVILDGHPDPNMPDLQINTDGTGGSRVNEIDWYQYQSTVLGEQSNTGLTSNYFLRQNYVYSPYSSTDTTVQPQRQHGASVATNASGSTLGHAPNANIYSFDPYTQSQKAYNNYDASSGYPVYTMFDYIRAWHNDKPINPETGVKNPTIVNCSFGYTLRYRENSGTWPVYAESRGIIRGTLNGSTPLTNTEMQETGLSVNHPNQISGTSPNREVAKPLGSGMRNDGFIDTVIADVEDAITDGIHFVISGGNSGQLNCQINSADYVTSIHQNANGDTLINKARSYAPVEAILVGALSGTTQTNFGGAYTDDRAECPVYYTNKGEGIDVYMFADGTTAGLNSGSTSGITDTATDPRNGSYLLRQFNGTSAAAPNTTGVLACILERFPDMTPAQAKAYLISRCNGIEGTAGEAGYREPASNLEAWADQWSFDLPNETPKIVMNLTDIRAQSGRIEIKNQHDLRKTAGVVFPRQRQARTRRIV
tara:strand:+ start:15864 stop:17756 length:1893 start_codon:yes stop_codon:yes gene_type:complete